MIDVLFLKFVGHICFVPNLHKIHLSFSKQETQLYYKVDSGSLSAHHTPLSS